MKIEMLYFKGKFFDSEFKIVESHSYLYSIVDEEDVEYIKNRIIGKLKENYTVQLNVNRLNCLDESV